MPNLQFVVTGIPPSNNHYSRVQILRSKNNGKYYPQHFHTDAAKDWWQRVRIAAAGQRLEADSYEVSFIVYMPDLRVYDVDNMPKTIFDGLKHAEVITDDRYIDDFHGHRRLDRINPRTVISIRAAQGKLF